MSSMRERVRMPAVLVFAGVLGLGAGSMLAPDEVGAFGCTEDECELGSSCATNAGNSTECDVTGPGSCKTVSCDVY